MKTTLQNLYERAVITRVCKTEISDSDKIELMIDFHNNSESYYDHLCDALLAVSTHQNPVPIWITQNGDFYLSLRALNTSDRVLLYPDEVPAFTIDLVDQLETAILSIK